MNGSKQFSAYDWLCGEHVIRAVQTVYAKYQQAGKKPGSEDWKDLESRRREVMRDVRAEWCRQTGYSPDEFYVAPKAVLRLWTKARKIPGDDKVFAVAD